MDAPAFGRVAALDAGFPVTATGPRLDRRGARYGLETMCIGGSQGLVAVFERTGLR